MAQGMSCMGLGSSPSPARHPSAESLDSELRQHPSLLFRRASGCRKVQDRTLAGQVLHQAGLTKPVNNQLASGGAALHAKIAIDLWHGAVF